MTSNKALSCYGNGSFVYLVAWPNPSCIRSCFTTNAFYEQTSSLLRLWTEWKNKKERRLRRPFFPLLVKNINCWQAKQSLLSPYLLIIPTWGKKCMVSKLEPFLLSKKAGGTLKIVVFVAKTQLQWRRYSAGTSPFKNSRISKNFLSKESLNCHPHPFQILYWWLVSLTKVPVHFSAKSKAYLKTKRKKWLVIGTTFSLYQFMICLQDSFILV